MARVVTLVLPLGDQCVRRVQHVPEPIFLHETVPSSFRPPRRGAARITLAWIGTGGPLFAPMGDQLATVIVVWPTDTRGRLLDDVEARGGTVARWDLTVGDHRDLVRIAEVWDLDRVDLRVRPHRVDPCCSSLRAWPGFGRHEPAIEAMIARLRTAA